MGKDFFIYKGKERRKEKMFIPNFILNPFVSFFYIFFLILKRASLKGNVLVNLPDDVVSHLARLCAALLLALTYPVRVLFCITIFFIFKFSV